MRRLTTATPVQDFVGHYGPNHNRQGILSEHLHLIDPARVRTLAGGSRFVADDRSSRAYPVLCSEIVPVYTEDGVVDGRCGGLADEYGFCSDHRPAEDMEATCEHGLAAWLCSGPMHY